MEEENFFLKLFRAQCHEKGLCQTVQEHVTLYAFVMKVGSKQRMSELEKKVPKKEFRFFVLEEVTDIINEIDH